MRTLRILMGAMVLPLALGACRMPVVETAPAPPPGVMPGPPPPTADAVPAGTVLTLQLNQRLSTADNRVGDRFTATVLDPLVAADGRVAIPRGAVVSGVITGLSPGRAAVEPAVIRLDFERITVANQAYPFDAEILETDARLVHDQRRILEHAALGAAAGAILGAVIGGRLRDILIVGALGAGAGTIISLGWGEVQAELPAGTAMTVRTTQHIAFR